jgi:hypothetical protein
MEIFEANGDNLGTFLDIVEQFKYDTSLLSSCTLLELDLKDSLVEYIEIEVGNRKCAMFELCEHPFPLCYMSQLWALGK